MRSGVGQGNFILVAALLAMLSCAQEKKGTPSQSPNKVVDTVEVRPAGESETAKSSEAIPPKVEERFARRLEPFASTTLAADAVVVLHRDSMPNPVSATRTREEARMRIGEALKKINQGAEFAAVAKEYSDHPSKDRGGDIGNLETDLMPANMVRALLALENGQYTPEPVETYLGFQILRRKEPAPVVQLTVSMIVVSHQDAKPNPTGATRTKEEAILRTREAVTLLDMGEPFAEVAKKFSDDETATAGGLLGKFKPDEIRPDFAEILLRTPPLTHSKDVLDLENGYHVLYRGADEAKK